MFCKSQKEFCSGGAACKEVLVKDINCFPTTCLAHPKKGPTILRAPLSYNSLRLMILSIEASGKWCSDLTSSEG